MELGVARLREPQHLAVPAVADLFRAAFDGSQVFPGGFEGMVEDMADLVADPKNFVLLGLQDGAPRALCIILLPSNKITPFPQVLHFYNGGPSPLRKKLIKAGVEILREKGYVKFVAVNATGKPDSVWARTFRLAGKSKVIGGIVEFELA